MSELGSDYLAEPDPPEDWRESEWWTTRDGRRMLVSEMTDQHLNAAIYCTQGKAPNLVRELKRRHGRDLPDDLIDLVRAKKHSQLP